MAGQCNSVRSITSDVDKIQHSIPGLLKFLPRIQSHYWLPGNATHILLSLNIGLCSASVGLSAEHQRINNMSRDRKCGPGGRQRVGHVIHRDTGERMFLFVVHGIWILEDHLRCGRPVYGSVYEHIPTPECTQHILSALCSFRV